MRKVKFRKFIPSEYEFVPVDYSSVEKLLKSGYRKLKPGTGVYEEEYNGEGLFHAWGVDYKEFDDGIGSYSVALIEVEDGSIVGILPKMVKFMEK